MSQKVELYPFKHQTDKTTGWLSQWYDAPFKDDQDESVYVSTEQYMMIKKAILFGDKEMEMKMRLNRDPKALQKLGRQVQGFQQDVWDKHKETIVEHGNYLKFSQNPLLKQKLLDTGDTLLVETFPHDRIWACGLASTHPDFPFPERWPGSNLLGKALMNVRTRLHQEEAIRKTQL